MEQIIVSTLSVNELLDRISKLIDSKLNQAKPVEKKGQNYLSRLEVCTLLKISLPTLNDWSKLGRLQSYKIGNRVLYKQDEVENSLHQVSSLKFKRA